MIFGQKLQADNDKYFMKLKVVEMLKYLVLITLTFNTWIQLLIKTRFNLKRQFPSPHIQAKPCFSELVSLTDELFHRDKL